MKRKYSPLQDHLRRSKSDRLRFSFSMIEKLLHDSLPKSADSYREWWANQSNTSNRPQAAAWLDAGFKVDTVVQDKNKGWVEFMRV